MSESDAVDAMLSRLSFSASIRAEQLALQEANKLSVKQVMKVSCIFCLLVSRKVGGGCPLYLWPCVGAKHRRYK